MPLELRHFAVYLTDNWDGEGGHAVQSEVFQRTRTLLSMLPKGLGKGNAMAGVDGSVGLFWSIRDIDLYVDMLPDGRVRYFYSDRKNLRASDTLPSDVDRRDVVAALEPVFRAMLRTDGHNWRPYSLKFAVEHVEPVVQFDVVTTGTVYKQQAFAKPVSSAVAFPFVGNTNWAAHFENIAA